MGSEQAKRLTLFQPRGVKAALQPNAVNPFSENTGSNPGVRLEVAIRRSGPQVTSYKCYDICVYFHKRT
jgi:hypothetical protein